MTLQQCKREHEVVEAVSTGRWTGRTCEELRAHVSGCAICKDVVDVATALRNDYDTASQDIRVPSAGLVWWRAELRSRREAMRAAERPMKLAHAFAAACAAGVVIALMSQMSPWFRQAVTLLLTQHGPLALTLGVLILIAPVALYFVFSDK